MEIKPHGKSAIRVQRARRVPARARVWRPGCGEAELGTQAQAPTMRELEFLSALLLFGSSTAYDNGLALQPPLSWRSWNAFGWRISADTFRVAARGLTDTSRAILRRPAGTSLRSLGYSSVGMDEGWAWCEPEPGFPPSGSMFHRGDGSGGFAPVVNATLFPDMKGLVAEVHSLGLQMGWYLNPCFSYCWALGDACGDACTPGDVAAALGFQFDSVKIDGCSKQHNTSLFRSLLNASGVPVLIENCHDEGNPVAPISAGGCPDFHMYRSSTDIRNTYGSWLQNAYSVQQYTDGRTGPTCWAYPDMLMIGVGPTCAGDTCAAAEPPLPSLPEQRTHFGLWCILSSPLTLSVDFGNASRVDSVWGVITNVDAIAVNQRWAGLPGGQLAQRSADNVTLEHCSPEWAGDKNCSVPATQGWYKPLPGGAVALLLVNNDPAASPRTVRADFARVPGLACAPTCAVFDVWAQAPAAAPANGFFEAALASHDSAFVVLSAPAAPWAGA